MSTRKLADPVATILGVPGRLKALRVAFGSSQGGIAALLGMKPSQWNRYEKGRRVPDWKVLQLIAAKTDRSVRWILTGRDEEPDQRPWELVALLGLVERYYREHGSGDPLWSAMMAGLERALAVNPAARSGTHSRD